MTSLRSPSLRPRSESVLIVLGFTAFALMPALPALPLCPVKLLTGVDCPTCGVTRALFAVMHGQLALAAGLNPAAYVVVAAAARRLALLNLPQRAGWRRALERPGLEYGLLAVFFLLGVVHVATA